MNYDPDFDLIFKLLLVGSSSVGKSSLLQRLCNDYFPENFIPTVGVDFKIKTFEYDDSVVKLQIWDTAGQERFKTITSSYYKGANGVMLVFDISNKSSFEELDEWIDEVHKNSSKDILKYLVGNKCDLADNRAVTREDAEEYAKLHSMKYIETSAKDSTNVESAFIDMSKLIRDRVFSEQGVTMERLIEMKKKSNVPSKLKSEPQVQKKGCC